MHHWSLISILLWLIGSDNKISNPYETCKNHMNQVPRPGISFIQYGRVTRRLKTHPSTNMCYRHWSIQLNVTYYITNYKKKWKRVENMYQESNMNVNNQQYWCKTIKCNTVCDIKRFFTNIISKITLYVVHCRIFHVLLKKIKISKIDYFVLWAKIYVEKGVWNWLEVIDVTNKI